VPTSARHYHEITKHHFGRFARSAGYLDWNTQPNPFRRYDGAPFVELPRRAVAADRSYRALYEFGHSPLPLSLDSVGELVRCAFGLSAWKSIRGTRWALRVNPSSGNLHPTEVYVVWRGDVFHYAADTHGFERRGAVDVAAWDAWAGEALLVGLTSIHWREAWKYGERAYRYCQHDAGHAIGALRFSAARLGWRASLLPRWSDTDVAALLGIDRDADAGGAERETPACLAVVTPGDPALVRARPAAPLVAALRAGEWCGTANLLSRGHVDWPVIDDVARAAAYPGRDETRDPEPVVAEVRDTDVPGADTAQGAKHGVPSARAIILQRRSAVAFDPREHLPLAPFLSMLHRVRPSGPPWDVIDWPPAVHLVLFVHRVEGLVPGIYVYLRDPGAEAELRAAMRPEFLWEPLHGDLRLLVPTDVTWVANRLSCDQDIAGEAFFSLGMLARFEPLLAEQGDWVYRRLFWECGLIGQVLYLEAEAAGVRGTGVGCFYDDPVHETLGLDGHGWQSLYHFCVGAPIEDTRLETTPGYAWEGL
jgi:SagB-type dehydrogenase family enzyme